MAAIFPKQIEGGHCVATVARKSSAPAAARGKFDAEVDIIVVGSGVAGLATALFSRWHGNKVLVLEKVAELGGTTRKAAFWYWVPNNAAMRAAGTKDPKKDCIRYMARLSRPEIYNSEAPRFGVPEWEYSQYEAVYDNASAATEMLSKKGALEYRHCDFVPDYWAELPEDKAPKGRVLLPKGARESMSDGGEVAIQTMSAAAKRDGVDIRTGHRVQRVIKNTAGEIIGVEADATKGRKRFFARKAVVFCSGGFTHNVELRKNYLNVPVYGGCAAMSNEGDFVYIASPLGAQLRNMNYAWMCPIVFEKAIARDPGLIGTFSPSGNSMIYVNKEGRRVSNEKLAYNKSAQTSSMGRSALRIPEPFADRDLGPAQPGSQCQRRVWPLHRSARDRRRARDQGRLDCRLEQSDRRASGALRESHRRPETRSRLPKNTHGYDQAVQWLRVGRQGF